MSIYTTLVFVALAALGALIAYLADLTGAWLGKRRSTIFGLRPRQSARLFVAIIGALLPLLGLAVATIGSDYARKAVFELNDLLMRQTELKQEVGDLQGRVDLFERRAADAESRADEAEQRARELEAVKEEQKEQIVGLTERTDELQGRADDLRGRVGRLTDMREKLEGELGEAETQLSEAEADLARAESDLTATREQRERLKERVSGLRTKVSNRVNQLGNVNEQLEQAQRRLEPTERELKARQRELAERERQLADVEERLESVRRRHELISERRALFEPGEELIRIVLPSDETQDQMEADLFEFLHLASAVAERQGVPEGENGRAVVVVAPVPEWAAARDVPEGMIVEDVATKLRTGGADEWVVMVRVFRRYFPGDNTQVAVEFRATANRLVFSEGQVIDEFVIDSDVTALEAFERLWLRIANQQTSKVRAQAIAEGMLPHPETGNYGSVDLADLFNAAETIRSGSGLMRVRVKAAKDAHTRGPLVLDIEVAEADEPS